MDVATALTWFTENSDFTIEEKSTGGPKISLTWTFLFFIFKMTGVLPSSSICEGKNTTHQSVLNHSLQRGGEHIPHLVLENCYFSATKLTVGLRSPGCKQNFVCGPVEN